MTRIVLIGEAPGKRGRRGEAALCGRIGRRLAKLMNVTEYDYRWRTRRENLLPRWPGKAPAGHGTAWPAKLARGAARRMERRGLFAPRDRVVILLGRRVAAAFGFSQQDWFAPFCIAPTQGLAAAVIVAPHPSGASRWWNEPRNWNAARRFWLGIGERMMA